MEDDGKPTPPPATENENTEDAEQAPDSSRAVEKTEPGGSGDGFIKLRVLGNESNEIHFRVKMTTQMHKLMKSYSERMSINLAGLRFLFDGRRIAEDDTPKSLDMEDDDVIEVYQEQSGGWLLR